MAAQSEVLRYVRKVAYLRCPEKVCRAIRFEFGPDQRLPSIDAIRSVLHERDRAGANHIVGRGRVRKSA